MLSAVESGLSKNHLESITVSLQDLRENDSLVINFNLQIVVVRFLGLQR